MRLQAFSLRALHPPCDTSHSRAGDLLFGAEAVMRRAHRTETTTHKKKKKSSEDGKQRDKKKNEMKDKCAAGCSPAYSWYTGALLLCLAALLGADRHFKVCTRRLSSIEKARGGPEDGRPVGAGTLQGRDQLEHLVFTASTHTHTHTGFYTHVRWPHGSTRSPPACYIYLLTHEQALIACLSPHGCTCATYKHTHVTYTLGSHITASKTINTN